jgi:hypothetical protein
MFWNENGERVDVMISASDASVSDIPRVMREHRDLRRALAKAVKLLSDAAYAPSDDSALRDLEFIKRTKSHNPI